MPYKARIFGFLCSRRQRANTHKVLSTAFIIWATLFGCLLTSNTNAQARTTYGFVYLQIEQPSGDNQTLQQNSGMECMRARERIRFFNGYSWVLAVFLALGIYAIWLWQFPRFLSSGGKWFISPILSSLVIATLVAYLENSYLTAYCSNENSSWRFDTLAMNFVKNWFIFVLGIFCLLALYRYIQQIRRMRVLKTT